MVPRVVLTATVIKPFFYWQLYTSLLIKKYNDNDAILFIIVLYTLGTRGFSRVRREFSVLAEGRHVFGRRPKPRAAKRLGRNRKPR